MVNEVMHRMELGIAILFDAYYEYSSAPIVDYCKE